jgi:NAD(P)H-flavin reductase
VDATTDPNWKYNVGFVPTSTKQKITSAENAIAIVCGPPIMIKFTQPVLEELGFPPERIFLSLEMRMKCGIGMCGRCNIGDKFVCKDGPVFSLAQLKQLPPEY